MVLPVRIELTISALSRLRPPWQLFSVRPLKTASPLPAQIQSISAGSYAPISEDQSYELAPRKRTPRRPGRSLQITSTRPEVGCWPP